MFDRGISKKIQFTYKRVRNSSRVLMRRYSISFFSSWIRACSTFSSSAIEVCCTSLTVKLSLTSASSWSLGIMFRNSFLRARTLYLVRHSGQVVILDLVKRKCHSGSWVFLSNLKNLRIFPFQQAVLVKSMSALDGHHFLVLTGIIGAVADSTRHRHFHFNANLSLRAHVRRGRVIRMTK